MREKRSKYGKRGWKRKHEEEGEKRMGARESNGGCYRERLGKVYTVSQRQFWWKEPFQL